MLTRGIAPHVTIQARAQVTDAITTKISTSLKLTKLAGCQLATTPDMHKNKLLPMLSVYNNKSMLIFKVKLVI